MLALDSLSMTLACWFAETTLVASALALVAYVAARFGKPGPAFRHVLWVVVLIKLMTPPIVHWPWSRSLVPLVSTPVSEAPRIAVRTHLSPSPTPMKPARPPRVEVRGQDSDIAFSGDPVELETPSESRASWPSPGLWFLAIWLTGSVAVGADQLRRIARFRRLFLDARSAPYWLVAEAQTIGRRLSVRVPTIKVVDRLGTPLLWCLGRPVLLVPADLLKSLEADRWRGVLAHELAHLRRGDPWVGRLELVALLVWWWNPLYWLARSRIDFEAEVACDAWVLWALPDDRIEYAESLVRICTIPRSARTPAPSLGVAGAGRSFERRLIMILRERVARDASIPGLLAASLLAAIALPSWTLADETPAPVVTTADVIVRVLPSLDVAVALIGDDDDDADDDDSKDAKKEKAAKDKAKAKADAKAKVKAKVKIDSADGKPLALPKEGDADFEKKMEEFGEKLGREMEKKFGPGSDFEKKMEAFAKDMESKFGPDFEKKMEEFGKEIEKKFGHEFAEEMKGFGDKMAKEFGPGSDFEKKAKDMAAKVKAEAEKGRAEAEKGRAEAAKARAEAAKVKADAARAKGAEARAKAEAARPTPAARTKANRARRIEMLESRIDEMMKELKQLKDQGDKEDDDEEEGDKGGLGAN